MVSSLQFYLDGMGRARVRFAKYAAHALAIEVPNPLVDYVRKPAKIERVARIELTIWVSSLSRFRNLNPNWALHDSIVDSSRGERGQDNQLRIPSHCACRARSRKPSGRFAKMGHA
jgi:hypothetical protein